MKLSDIVGNAGLAFYPQVALVLFLLAFAAVVVRLYLPSQQALWERAGRMALDDGEPADPAPGDPRGRAVPPTTPEA